MVHVVSGQILYIIALVQSSSATLRTDDTHMQKSERAIEQGSERESSSIRQHTSAYVSMRHEYKGCHSSAQTREKLEC